MNFNVKDRTILRVTHGSHAYGLNIATSDIDIKGVCIEPIKYHFGYLHHFDQYEQSARVHEHDLVIYSLKKFFKLASDCNPNIIEILFVDQSDVLFCDAFGQRLRDNAGLFLSKKARFTFAGYAHSQLKRIKTHRNWLLQPPKGLPTRTEFGLIEGSGVSKSELGAFEALDGDNIKMSTEVMQLFGRERAFRSAKMQWDQYQQWKRDRNPDRADLERLYGYDVKHGMHLIRLMRMCREILRDGQVIVKRPDRGDLLAVRSGEWSYEKMIEHAEEIDAECEQLYITSLALPKAPNHNTLDALLVDMTSEYVSKNG